MVSVLGISAFYHDSAAALIDDGRIVAAAQEERFTRVKNDASYPEHAVAYCLEAGGIRGDEIDFVAFYDKPFLKFERLLETYLAFAPRGFSSFARSIPLWVREKLLQKSLLVNKLKDIAPNVDWKTKLVFSEHHQSHAASAFFPSPFDEALVLTMDGVGEWTTTSAAVGSNNSLEIIREIHFPHSLGLLYSAFTYHIGFKVNSGEYKVMGLAPYGVPRFAQTIRDNLIDIKDDGSFRLNLSYFDYCTGLRMTNERFDGLFEGPRHNPNSPLTQREMDLAASIQVVTEEVVLRLVRSLIAQTGLNNVCLAGGVALNCVANGKVLREPLVKALWVQPAAGDAGGALGSALACYHQFCDKPRTTSGTGDAMNGSYLGPAFSDSEINERLTSLAANFETVTDAKLFELTVSALEAGKAVGWMQGGMEYGPRALGARSILADPRPTDAQSTLNRKVKFREDFRPFAPAVLQEDASEWFDIATDSPYMSIVAEVDSNHLKIVPAESAGAIGLQKLAVARSDIPAVTHVDLTARLQTVGPETNAKFYALLSKFAERTGCPVLVNTSFNVRGEPIVCTPEDAFRCFMGTGLDLLVIGNAVLRKVDQDPDLAETYLDRFDPD